MVIKKANDILLWVDNDTGIGYRIIETDITDQVDEDNYSREELLQGVYQIQLHYWSPKLDEGWMNLKSFSGLVGSYFNPRINHNAMVNEMKQEAGDLFTRLRMSSHEDKLIQEYMEEMKMYEAKINKLVG